MAEIFGTAMSIVAVLETCKKCNDVLSTMKSRNPETQRLRYEMTNLESLLYLLNARSPPKPVTSSQANKDLDTMDPLVIMQQRIETITSKIQTSKRTLERQWQKMEWAFKEKEEVMELLDGLERDKLLINLALQGDHLILSEAIKNDISNINNLIADVGQDVRIIKDKQQVQERREIIDWLTPLDFWKKQNDLLEDRQSLTGTGQWFLTSTEFRKWIESPGQVLYCLGAPGSGKTTMTSIVVEHLVSVDKDLPVAMIFFNHGSQNQYSLSQLLASLLKQLVQRLPEFPKDLQDLYNQRRLQGGSIQLSEIKSLLESIIQQQKRVFFLFDALDEYGWEERIVFLDSVTQLCKADNVNIFLTSRPNVEIDACFPNFIHFDFQANEEANKKDIRQFLELHLKSGSALVRKSYDLQQEIINGICNVAKGVFLVAKLLLEVFKSKTATPRTIKKALETLATESAALGQIYDNAIDRIAPNDRVVAYRLLGWLTYARQDLTPKEIRHAFAIQDDDHKMHEDMLPEIEDLVSCCEGLVVIDIHSNVVRLTHFTAQEYLKSSQRFVDAELDITTTCLTYLTLKELVRPVQKSRAAKLLNQYPFLSYAARYWGSHFKAIPSKSKDVRLKALDFLRQPYRLSDTILQHFSNYVAEIAAYNNWKDSNSPVTDWEAMGRFDVQMSGIYVAIFFDMPALLETLLDEGADPNSRNNVGGHPLCWAAKLNHLRSARILLDRNSDVNANVGGGYTPLSHACRSASLQMVKLLLDAGADVNLRSSRRQGETALHDACFYDRANVAEELLNRGAKINIGLRHQHRVTPLSYTVDAGRPKCFRLLAFQFNAFTPENTRGLRVPFSSLELLRELHAHHVDPNQDYGVGQGALDVALQFDDNELVKSLIKQGAQPRLFWTKECNEIASRKNESWYPELEQLIAANPPPVYTRRRDDEVVFENKQINTEPYLIIDMPSPPPTKIIFTIVSHDQGTATSLNKPGTYVRSPTYFIVNLRWKEDESKSGGNEDATGTQEVLTENEEPREPLPATESTTQQEHRSAPSKHKEHSPKTRTIINNAHASKEWKKHRVCWDRKTGPGSLQSWFGWLDRPGCAMHIYARADGKGVENHVKEMKVDLFD